MEISEAFDVQHVNLVNKENTGHELCNPVINVFIDHLVDLSSQFVRYFSFLRLHELPHHGHDVLPALGPRIGHVQVVEGDVLDDFLPLVNIALIENCVKSQRFKSEIFPP